MSVTSSTPSESGLYTPFRGFDREAGAVGTLSVDAEATGDGSGGTVTIVISMKFEQFGFHSLWIPTRVSSLDNLASPEVVEFSFRSSGNDRLAAGDLREAATALATGGANNVASFSALGVSIEVRSLTNVSVMQVRWTTNTNALLYHLHVFGILYDGEALARGKAAGKAPEQLLGGVR